MNARPLKLSNIACEHALLRLIHGESEQDEYLISDRFNPALPIKRLLSTGEQPDRCLTLAERAEFSWFLYDATLEQLMQAMEAA